MGTPIVPCFRVDTRMSGDMYAITKIPRSAGRQETKAKKKVSVPKCVGKSFTKQTSSRPHTPWDAPLSPKPKPPKQTPPNLLSGSLAFHIASAEVYITW